jgi:hypothetical protein
MRHFVSVFAVAAVMGIAAAVPASAKTCEQTIAASFATFVRQHLKLIQHCRELVLIGRAAGPCPDFRTALQLDKTRAKLRERINQQCGGADHSCGTGGDDVDLADLGWNVAQCPNLHDGSCTNAIQHCGDVVDCLQCIGETAVDRATALVYDEVTLASPLSQVGRCQKTLGRSVRRYFDSTTATLATCEQADLDGTVPGACPDLLKAQPRLARAEEKLVDRICHSCGSSDEVCGGDDLLPDWIGFVDTCPDVTLPSGESCARPIHQLIDVIACVRCVTDFQVGCMDPLSVPTLKGYPGSCPP